MILTETEKACLNDTAHLSHTNIYINRVIHININLHDYTKTGTYPSLQKNKQSLAALRRAAARSPPARFYRSFEPLKRP